MGRHHHATGNALGSYRHLRTIVKAAHHLTFRTLLDLIRGQVQTCLNTRVIEDTVFFAARYKGEANQVGEDSPGTILAVEPQQGTRLWEVVRCEIARDSREGLAQFRSVASVASIAKTADLSLLPTG
jgi:hypothetical protein